MAGIKDLGTLLSSIDPVLDERTTPESRLKIGILMLMPT